MEREGNQSLKAALDQEKGEIIMRKNTRGRSKTGEMKNMMARHCNIKILRFQR